MGTEPSVQCPLQKWLFFAIAVENEAKRDIRVFCSCLIFLILLIFAKYFVQCYRGGSGYFFGFRYLRKTINVEDKKMKRLGNIVKPPNSGHASNSGQNVKSQHGLLNTRPYMSHLKAKIKRPVFQKNSTK